MNQKNLYMVYLDFWAGFMSSCTIGSLGDCNSLLLAKILNSYISWELGCLGSFLFPKKKSTQHPNIGNFSGILKSYTRFLPLVDFP